LAFFIGHHVDAAAAAWHSNEKSRTRLHRAILSTRVDQD